MPHNYHIFGVNAFPIRLFFLSQTDQIIKQGCGALKLVREQRVNRFLEITFLITSLEMRYVQTSAFRPTKCVIFSW